MSGFILRQWHRLQGRRRFPHALVYGDVDARAEIEEGVWIPYGTTVNGNCRIGRYSYIMSPSVLSGVHIGNFSSIASGCAFLRFQHPVDNFSTFPFASRLAMHGRSFSPLYEEVVDKGPIRIEHDVWIGANSTIMGGVTIHTGAIVAAGSVVTKDVAPYSVVAGVPAREVRKRFSEAAIEKLLASAWWEWPLDEIQARGHELAGLTQD